MGGWGGVGWMYVGYLWVTSSYYDFKKNPLSSRKHWCWYCEMYGKMCFWDVCDVSAPDPLSADRSDKVLDMRPCEVLIIVLNQL